MRPPEDDVPLDPRLAPYRDRVALLYRGELQVGQILVEPDWWVESIGGRFWWRRWSEPTEAVRIHVLLDDAATDSLETPDAFDALIAQWAAGQVEVNGEVLRLEWLTERESRQAEEKALWVDASLQVRMDRVRRLWRMHKAASFPPRLRGEQIEGIDLAQLDADLADCVIAWIAGGGRLDAAKRGVLRRLVDDADLVLPSLAAEERVRFRRLQRMAHLANGADDHAGS